MMMLAFVVIAYVVYDQLKRKNDHDSQSVDALKQRYVRGEIDEETYRRIHTLIKG